MSGFTPTERTLSQSGRDDRFDLISRRGRPGRLAPEGSARITRRITALALGLGLIMAAGKFWLFLLTGSVGVMATLVHSLLDIVAAASSFIAVRVAALAPRKRYRFGFGKAESFSAVFQVCLIALAAMHLLGASLEALNPDTLQSASINTLPHSDHPGHEDHAGHFGHNHSVGTSTTAIIVLGLFSVLTIWLMIAQSWAIRATGSIAVRGDRAHYMADLFGNLFVMAGLAIATFTEAHWADPLVAAGLAIWLLWTAFRVASHAWAQLMDRELPEDDRKLIKAQIMTDPRIRAVTNLRTRASGPHLHMQMRLDVDAAMSLSDAHDVVLAAEKRLMTAFPSADILIHPHPVGCDEAHGNARFDVSDAP